MAYPDHYMAEHLTEERAIVDRIIRDALRRGYLITVSDGEEVALRWCNNYESITAEVAATDMTTLTLFPDSHAKAIGNIFLIHGNGGDVVGDYTDNPEVAAVVLWADLLGILDGEVGLDGKPWQLKALSDMQEEADALGRRDLVDELEFWAARWDSEVARPQIARSDEITVIEAAKNVPPHVLIDVEVREDGAAPMQMPMADFLATASLSREDFYALLMEGRAISMNGGRMTVKVI